VIRPDRSRALGRALWRQQRLSLIAAPWRWLEDDHGRILARLEAFLRHPGGAAEKVERLFQDHLVPHFHSEEQILFPYLSGLWPGSGPALAKLKKEHRQLNSLRRRLRAPPAKRIDLKRLITRLRTHIANENRLLARYAARAHPSPGSSKRTSPRGERSPQGPGRDPKEREDYL